MDSIKSAAIMLGSRGGKKRAANLSSLARTEIAQKAAVTRWSRAGAAPVEMLTGEQVIAKIARRTDAILLAFSCGKDSIAAWIACRPHFKRIVPFYMYLVPGLEFVERSLDYYEGVLGTHIYRIPHPSLYRMLNNCVFQPPDRVRVIADAGLPEFDYLEIQDELRKDLGLSETAYAAAGVRAADSPQRLMAVKKYGAINDKKRQFFPVWDWKKDRLIAAINDAGVKLPVDYKIWGRSFDGIDYRFLAGMRQHFPRDYARVLKWFPLADAEIARRMFAAGEVSHV